MGGESELVFVLWAVASIFHINGRWVGWWAVRMKFDSILRLVGGVLELLFVSGVGSQ